MICCRDTPFARSRAGSTSTCSCRSRWPQTDTLATPGTPINRGLMFQRASRDMSIRESSSEVSPTIITRLVDETGCNICGGFETCGSAWACVRRSSTT